MSEKTPCDGAFRSLRFEWRWPVVASDEPVGVRTIYGYVIVVAEMPHCCLKTASVEEATSALEERRWALSFLDSEERPIYVFEPEMFWVFAGAAARALNALGLSPGAAGPREPAGDIVR